ncbi:MAG: sulfatase [Planctomycetota bacterium]|nr:sulfatase [Planctomycetota bacterium]
MPLRSLTLALLAVVCFQSILAAAKSPPNIVFILIDDLGWMDLACQGNKLVETPNIDRFAKEGVRFTDAYAAAPVCSPTRASILTGLSPARLHITNHIPDQKRFIPKDAKLLPAPMINHLPLEHVTIAERLRDAGYRTGFIGKWHLCEDGSLRDGGVGDARFAPEKQGFDVNIAGCAYGGPPSFFSPYRIHNLPDGPQGEYMPDRLAAESINFMKESQAGKKPFMLFLWNYTVHWPMQAPENLLKKYETRTGPGLNDTRYGAMIEAMDTAIGRVLKSIDDLGLRDDTLVVFTSDNGAFGGVGDNRPLRRDKGWLYEGGIRVPLIIRWPGVTKPGRECSVPVISTDFYATLLEAAGLPLQEEHPARDQVARPQDGVSLVPILKGADSLDRKSLFFHYPNYAFHQANPLGGAIREGDFKLIENFADRSLELYNLKEDLSEKRNLASDKPDVARAMQQRLADWRKVSGAAMPLPVPKSD